MLRPRNMYAEVPPAGLKGVHLPACTSVQHQQCPQLYTTPRQCGGEASVAGNFMAELWLSCSDSLAAPSGQQPPSRQSLDRGTQW